MCYERTYILMGALFPLVFVRLVFFLALGEKDLDGVVFFAAGELFLLDCFSHAIFRFACVVFFFCLCVCLFVCFVRERLMNEKLNAS